MDNIEELSDSLQSFPALWKRVTETAPEPVFSNEKALAGFIREEFCTSLFYGSLSRMFTNKSKTELVARSADAKRRLRRLRAEYFIRTGITLTPTDKCPSVAGKLASLREVMTKQTETAREYRNAAEQTDCPVLRELFRAYERELTAAAQSDRALLVESFQT